MRRKSRRAQRSRLRQSHASPEQRDTPRSRAPLRFESASCAFDGGPPSPPDKLQYQDDQLACVTTCDKYMRVLDVREFLHSKEAWELTESRGGVGLEKVMKIPVITFTMEEGKSKPMLQNVEFVVKYEVEGQPDSENAYFWVEFSRPQFTARLKFLMDVSPRHPSSSYTAREISLLTAALLGGVLENSSPYFDTQHLK